MNLPTLFTTDYTRSVAKALWRTEVLGLDGTMLHYLVLWQAMVPSVGMRYTEFIPLHFCVCDTYAT